MSEPQEEMPQHRRPRSLRYSWPPGEPEPRQRGRTAAIGAAVAVAVAALGAPLGLLWAALVPSVPVRMTEQGAVLAASQPEEFVAADGWFTIVGVAFGAAAAGAAWVLLRRHRGPVMLAAVALGGVGAGLLAWWLGRQFGLAEYERLLGDAAVGTTFGKPADLRAAEARLLFGFLPMARGDVLIPGLSAAVAYTLLAGWSTHPSLRAEEDAGPPGAGPAGAGVSSGWPAPPDPPAAPAPPAPGEAVPPRD
ncbi:MAG TPA: DUF2567 domain-containing protein [Pilimelia sp.]|nr:DUF2567 domain-containing protein [Pilimelia sp.]